MKTLRNWVLIAFLALGVTALASCSASLSVDPKGSGKSSLEIVNLG